MYLSQVAKFVCFWIKNLFCLKLPNCALNNFSAFSIVISILFIWYLSKLINGQFYWRICSLLFSLVIMIHTLNWHCLFICLNVASVFASLKSNCHTIQRIAFYSCWCLSHINSLNRWNICMNSHLTKVTDTHSLEECQ